MKKFLFALLLGLSVALPTFAYTVRPGDTLWGLYGSNWRTVAQEYGITDPRKLQVGTELPSPNQGYFGTLLGSTANIPNTPALIDTYLAIGIDADDTSMTLANGTTRAGTTLTGFMCFTLDVNTPVVEYVCGTANGTSVTGLLRGVDLSNPNTTSTSLAQPHRRFASVQISDYPVLAILVRILQGLDSTPGGIQFGTGTIYGATTALLSSQTSSLANVEYVNNVATSGAPNASTVTKGLVEKATNAEVEAGTATGTTLAPLFVGPDSWLEYADTHYSNNLAVGETVAAFNIVYISSTGKYMIAHGNVQSEIDKVAAVAFESASTSSFPRVLFPGSIVYGTAGMTTGSLVYLSNSGTASTTVGSIRKVLGLALGTNVWQFNPTVQTPTNTPGIAFAPVMTNASGTIPLTFLPTSTNGYVLQSTSTGATFVSRDNFISSSTYTVAAPTFAQTSATVTTSIPSTARYAIIKGSGTSSSNGGYGGSEIFFGGNRIDRNIANIVIGDHNTGSSGESYKVDITWNTSTIDIFYRSATAPSVSGGPSGSGVIYFYD